MQVHFVLSFGAEAELKPLRDQLLRVISFTHNVHIPLGLSHSTQQQSLGVFIFFPSTHTEHNMTLQEKKKKRKMECHYVQTTI